EYRTAEVESLKIIFDSEWGTHAAPGYLPVRFDITNLGDARVIEIVGDGMRYSRMMRVGGPTQLRIRQLLRMARGDGGRFPLAVAVFAESENIRFEIQEDGRTLERFNYTSVQGGTPWANASALIVADRATPFGAMAASWPRAAGTGMGGSLVIAGSAGARTGT